MLEACTSELYILQHINWNNNRSVLWCDDNIPDQLKHDVNVVIAGEPYSTDNSCTYKVGGQATRVFHKQLTDELTQQNKGKHNNKVQGKEKEQDNQELSQ